MSQIPIERMHWYVLIVAAGILAWIIVTCKGNILQNVIIGFVLLVAISYYFESKKGKKNK